MQSAHSLDIVNPGTSIFSDKIAMSTFVDNALTDTLASLPLQSSPNDPKTYSKTSLRPDADRWMEALEIEKESVLITSLASPITHSQAVTSRMVMLSSIQ